MTSPDASPFPLDPDYAPALKVMTAARLDATNQMLREHLSECPACQNEPFGFCPVALLIIANPPRIEPRNN